MQSRHDSMAALLETHINSRTEAPSVFTIQPGFYHPHSRISQTLEFVNRSCTSWAFDIEPAKTHHIQEPWSYPVYLTVSKWLMPNGSVCSKLTHHGQEDSSSSSSSLSTSCSFFFDRHHHHHTFISSRTFRDERKNLISSDPQSIAALFASSPAPKSKIIRLNCLHAHTHAWWTQLRHICSGRLWAWATEFGPSDLITMRAH